MKIVLKSFPLMVRNRLDSSLNILKTLYISFDLYAWVYFLVYLEIVCLLYSIFCNLHLTSWLIHESRSFITFFYSWELPWLKFRTLHLALLNLMRFTCIQLSFSSSLRMASEPLGFQPHHSASCYLQTFCRCTWSHYAIDDDTEQHWS